jgi:transcriptional regulator with XRE-family HTH domain
MATRSWTVRSPEDFGRVIAEIRRERGMTQEELAATGGLTRAWLAQLETGRTARSLEHILRLLRRLGASVTVTVGDDRG